MLSNRLRILIVLKQHAGKKLSKRESSELTGLNHNTVQKWRKKYELEGISAFLVHEKKGGGKRVITEGVSTFMGEILSNAENGIVGFKELQRAINEQFSAQYKYITILSYAKKHFKAKIKVARKSHIKKEQEAVEAFKKTLVKTVRT